MTSNSWEQKLARAGSVEEVLGAARDFLARFDPQEIEAIPAKCRPPAKLVDSDDIGMYAYDLVRHECDDAGAAEVIHRLARFFSQASMRVAHLQALERAARVAEDEAQEHAAAAPRPRSRLAQ